MTALATVEPNAIAAINSNIYESLALRGDLSALKPQEKVGYYRALCERLKLDPTTQPFQILKLNGREILYATRGATDQLARIHHLTRQVVSREEVRGVYLVTVQARLPNNRTEEAIGAVTIENLKGDALANALMKAESKAKRRVTLSILGLGLLDEVEIETIPQERVERLPTIEPVDERVSSEKDALLRARVAELYEEMGYDTHTKEAAMARAEKLSGADLERAVESVEKLADKKKAEVLGALRRTVEDAFLQQGWDEEEAARFTVDFGFERAEEATEEQLHACLEQLRTARMI